MHDPLVVAFQIRRPWPRRPWSKRFSKYRRFYFPSVVTIWHREPGNRDSGEVCKHWANGKPLRSWRWHVWHWHVQIHLVQALRRWLLERCELCGRRYPWNYSPISHQWDAPGSRWFAGIQRRGYHHECSSLVILRRDRATDEELIRYLFAAVQITQDEDEAELLHRLTDPKRRSLEFQLAYRLTHLLGFERGEHYELLRTGDAGKT